MLLEAADTKFGANETHQPISLPDGAARKQVTFSSQISTIKKASNLRHRRLELSRPSEQNVSLVLSYAKLAREKT